MLNSVFRAGLLNLLYLLTAVCAFAEDECHTLYPHPTPGSNEARAFELCLAVLPFTLAVKEKDCDSLENGEPGGRHRFELCSALHLGNEVTDSRSCAIEYEEYFSEDLDRTADDRNRWVEGCELAFHARNNGCTGLKTSIREYPFYCQVLQKTYHDKNDCNQLFATTDLSGVLAQQICQKVRPSPAENQCLAQGGKFKSGRCTCGKALKTSTDTLPCPGLWGIELTFTRLQHGKLKKTEQEQIQLRWLKEIKKNCKVRHAPDRCQVSGTRVTYEDGFYYNVTLDPGVLEIKGPPITRPEWAHIQNRIQSDIFGIASRVGLAPHEHKGGGHLHADLTSHFKGNSQLLMDFVADLQNHPGLAMCALGQSFIINPPLALLGDQQRSQFEVLSSRDLSSYSHYPYPQKKLEAEINSLVTQVLTQDYDSGSEPTKSLSISLSTAFNLGTIELRFLRPQQNAQQVEMLMSLFEARIKFLEAFPHHPYHSVTYPKAPGLSSRGRAKENGQVIRTLYDVLNINQRCVNEFYNYVTQAGLDWNQYKTLLLDRHQGIEPDFSSCISKSVPTSDLDGLMVDVDRAFSAVSN